ncbi:MAG TPA: hypothetical protein VLA12_00730 [Planctomycetaceae bacterium]|nr:hypothetical protein [Planctomycetaceae bacterium]
MELLNRDEIEDEMLAALLLLWMAQQERFEDTPEFWQQKDDEDRAWLLYWLAAVFVASARQHGIDQIVAEEGVRVWGAGHAIRVMQGLRRHSMELLAGDNPSETIFAESRAKRLTVTEFTEARSAGGEYAKLVLGSISPEDLWFTIPDERRCAYCAPLHLTPRSEWLDIYNSKILPDHPEYAAYGPPQRAPAHPNCRCFIQYSGESNEDAV